MAESTLQITWSELKTEIGRYLGKHRTVGNWTANDTADVTACIKRGMRQFYFPPRVGPDERAHRWSFLRPQNTLIIWPDVTTADAITQSASSLSSGITTVTASGSVFYPSMEEKSIVFDESGNSFVIDEYVSATQVKVTGDATGEDGNTITIDSGDTFTLPWDYGGIAADGKFTYDNADNTLSHIDIVPDAQIRKHRENTVSTATPWLCAIVPMAATTTQAQRWEVMFHQPPNDTFTLHYRYHVLPDALVESTNEYPYGSAEHSETILESCLAIAESREKDASSTEHRDKFALLLQASIDQDSKYGQAAQVFGYNGDGSDGYDNAYPNRPYYRHNDLVTFNGNDGS